MTKNRVLAVALAFLGMLILMQPAAMADVTLTLTGVATGWSLDGVYTSPYDIKVSSAGPPPTSVSEVLACDDYATEIGVGDTWQANIYTIPADISDLKFVPPADLQDYLAAAILGDEIMENYTPTANQTLLGQYSFALWDVFDSSAVSGLDPTNKAAALADENMAETIAGDYLNHPALLSHAQVVAVGQIESDVQFYTPDPKSASQEFIGLSSTTPFSFHVPEASTLSGLALDLAVLFGGIFLIRKRIFGRGAV